MPLESPETRVRVEMVSFSLSAIEQDNLAKIIASGVLTTRNGSFTCHLDGSGNIKAIDKHQRVQV